MTELEKLVAAHVRHTVVVTLSGTTEKLAEEMAREALKDPAWRAELAALTRQYFAHTVAELRASPPPRRRKATRRRRRTR